MAGVVKWLQMCTHKPKQPDKSSKAEHERRQPSASEAPNLAESIIESVCPGIVAFDRQLRIIRANSRAAQLIDIGEYIDRSLAAGTDAKIWGNWSKLLESTITTGHKGDFKAVRYSFNGQKRLLHIVCTPLKESSTQQVGGAVVVIDDVTE